MTTKEMTKFLTFCKKIGLKQIKTKDFEAEFTDSMSKRVQPASAPLAVRQGEEPVGEKTPTEDDLLYWSVGYDPKQSDEDKR